MRTADTVIGRVSRYWLTHRAAWVARRKRQQSRRIAKALKRPRVRRKLGAVFSKHITTMISRPAMFQRLLKVE